MRFLIVGGTGFIGKELQRFLIGRGHGVQVLSRRTGWNVDAASDVIVNLAGEPIAGKRWTEIQKQKIIQSRLQATQAVVEALAQSSPKPKVLINASAIGFYGPRGDEILDESAGRGEGFLAKTCGLWENEARKAEKFGARVVLLRIGIVLGKGGGALAKMLPPFRFFIGGPLGSGRQWMSWIHIEDLVRLMEYVALEEGFRGPVNATAPNPVTMKEFARALGLALHRPAFMPVPGFALKILLGEMSEMLLTGQKVLPRKAQVSGFSFNFNKLHDSLKNLV